MGESGGIVGENGGKWMKVGEREVSGDTVLRKTQPISGESVEKRGKEIERGKYGGKSVGKFWDRGEKCGGKWGEKGEMGEFGAKWGQIGGKLGEEKVAEEWRKEKAK
jgi:hypothetical protein